MRTAAARVRPGTPLPWAATALRLLAAAALSALAPRAPAQDARRTQEIVFPEIAARTVGDAPFDIVAKATSGLAVALEVVSGPAALDGKKLSLADSPGLVIVRASQEGNTSFQPARPAERAFAVNPRPAAPGFTSEPTGASVEIGGIIVLSAAVSGEPMPLLQWRRDGKPLEGARERTLTIASATLADSGAYDVVATNASGAATSERARVSVAKRRQSISFRGSSTAVAGQPTPVGVDATSGLPVRLEVIAGAASLNGTLLTAQAGAVVVRASQEGDANYEAAQPATRMYMVSAAQQGPRQP